MAHLSDFVVYVIAHDDALRDSICVLLNSMRFPICSFNSANAFLRAERPSGKSCLILEDDMPDMRGCKLLGRLRSEGLRIPAIILTQPMTASAQSRSDVIALEKPCAPDTLIGGLESALSSDQPG
jgi:two-component system, LuxR family, response regulator FixJ